MKRGNLWESYEKNMWILGYCWVLSDVCLCCEVILSWEKYFVEWNFFIYDFM